MTDRTSQDLLIIIARAPIPGLTKTRLGASIGMEKAARLHTAFIADLAERFAPDGGMDFDVAWSFTPPDYDCLALLHKLVPRLPDDLRSMPQLEGTFAERLMDLFERAFREGYRRTLIMASDSPHLLVSTLGEGFARLRTANLVLGRVADGGYYVIGMDGAHDILDQSVMSTDSAADALVAAAHDHGLSVAEIEPSIDIDTEADLIQLIHLLSAEPHLAPRTLETLQLERIAPTFTGESQASNIQEPL